MRGIKYTELPDGNLMAKLTPEGKEELAELVERYGENDESIFIDLSENELCNGYHLVQPEQIGALTNSLIISDEVFDEYTTKEEASEAKLWWFPNYMVSSYLDGIENEGVIFQRAA